MSEPVVQLLRRFEPVTSRSSRGAPFSSAPAGRAERWNDMENYYRTLILADPGAGKTFEAKDRAKRIYQRGQKAFFIRIERINAQFEEAFEVGSAEEFTQWLRSNEEAWFFLDSVDEAQLDSPRALETAVHIFASRVHHARERAHIFITSREDAWQALSDQTLIDQYLPHGDRQAHASEDGECESFDTPTLRVFRLAGLKRDEIMLFAAHYGIGDVAEFFAAIERGNLMALAKRPLDLRALIDTWREDKCFGSRLEALRRTIDQPLATAQRKFAKPTLQADRLRFGIRALAAAVTLTGRSLICLPGAASGPDRITPTDILPDWTDAELEALLNADVFDDPVYQMVRFRHRDIRELLTAEWANALLVTAKGRAKVEGLFFRESYGEEVIVPRMRPILAWLVLFDAAIRQRALALEPEVVLEGGDPSKLPLQDRRELLNRVVNRIVTERRS